MKDSHDVFFREFAERIVRGDEVGIRFTSEDLPWTIMFQPHRHECYELHIRLSPVSGGPTEVEVICPRVCHYALTLEEHDRTHVWMLDPSQPEFHHRLSSRGLLSAEFLAPLIGLLERLRDGGDPGAERELRLFLALMSLRRPVPTPTKMDSSAKIHQLMRNLRLRYYRPDLSIAGEAAAVGYSPNYVQKKFHEILNTTPKDFLTTIRMDAAAKLIMEQRYPIKQVAMMCGYNYLPYFYRIFRKYYGCPPGKFVRLSAEREPGVGRRLTDVADEVGTDFLRPGFPASPRENLKKI